jgi:hypothetical protein
VSLRPGLPSQMEGNLIFSLVGAPQTSCCAC